MWDSAEEAACDRLETAGPEIPIYLNGKFYSGALNGVHRVADRLIRELDAAASEGRLPPRWRLTVLVPQADNWSPAFRSIRRVPQRFGHTQFWEQLILPRAAAGGLLVCLANLAPMLHRAKVTMVHDAQFRISPSSYPPRLRFGYRMLIPAGARSSARVLTVSDYARDMLETFAISSRDRTAIVPNGGDHLCDIAADDAASARLGVEPGRFCLMFGAAAAYKNTQVVIAAFRRPELAGMKLVVVGADPAFDDAELPDAIVPAGRIDDATLRGLYAQALCLLYPSRTEGFGLPPLEAMVSGCPVVSAPAGAMPEVCQDTVLYAAASDPAAWAAAILRLARSPELRRTKIAAGLRRAADFTWREAGERLIVEMAGALSAGARRSRTSRAPVSR